MWHRGDEVWLPPVVVESSAQVLELAVDHVAPGHIVRPPERIENLLAGDLAASVGRQEYKGIDLMSELVIWDRVHVSGTSR